MKIRLTILCLVCSLAALPVIRAQDDAPKKMTPKEDQTPLGEQMEKISGAYRKLSRQITDATKNEDSLKQVAIIKDATAAALKLEPAKEKDLPDADQAKFVADYQAKMKDFIATVGKLEDALKANDNVTAAAIVKDMKTQEDSDHSDFRKKKKKKDS
jgi:hypothetical protein